MDSLVQVFLNIFGSSLNSTADLFLEPQQGERGKDERGGRVELNTKLKVNVC